MNFSTKSLFFTGLLVFLTLFLAAFNRAYKANTATLVDAWLFAETNSLREGQLLPTISKAERLIKQSNQLSGVMLFDTSQEPPSNLLSIGEPFLVTPKVLSQARSKDSWWDPPYRYLIVRTVPGSDHMVLVFRTNIHFWMPLLIIVLALTLFFAGFVAFMSIRSASDKFNLFRNSLNSLVTAEAASNFLEKEAPAFAEVWRSTQAKLLKNQNELAIARAQSQVVSVAAQVAHDIRSPLSALSIATKSLQSQATPEQYSLLTSAIKRIEGIASDLLSTDGINSAYTPSIGRINPVPQTYPEVALLLKEIVEEKRSSLKTSTQIQLIAPAGGSGIVLLDQVLFGRIVSNLIQNAAEAAPQGLVSLEIFAQQKDLVIRITDNGKGIPKEVLQKLGKAPISFEKERGSSGNGLGVYHANVALSAMQATLEIESTVGVGTNVSLKFPFR